MNKVRIDYEIFTGKDLLELKCNVNKALNEKRTNNEREHSVHYRSDIDFELGNLTQIDGMYHQAVLIKYFWGGEVSDKLREIEELLEEKLKK